MNDGAPATARATDNCYISRVAGYSDLRCVVKRRHYWARSKPASPSGPVRWGLPTRQQASTGYLRVDPDRAGIAVVGHQRGGRSTDHRSQCGAEQPGPAVGRCRASGDASAKNDQCERHQSPRTQFVQRRPLTGPQWRMGSQGGWLTIRAIDKRTMTSLLCFTFCC